MKFKNIYTLSAFIIFTLNDLIIYTLPANIIL
jgi:hypothetical protein